MISSRTRAKLRRLKPATIAVIAVAAYFVAGRILQATDAPARPDPYPLWVYLVPAAAFGVIIGRWWALALPIVWLFLAPFAAPGAGHDDTGLIVWSAIVLAPFEAAVISGGVGARRVLRRLTSHPRHTSIQAPRE
jgi:hypothetical protein